MTIQEKRQQLRDLSNKAKTLKESLIEGASSPQSALKYSEMTINDIIIKYFYKDAKNTEFHTFKGWLKNGHAVKKGEKAFLIWGRPKGVQDKEQGKDTDKETTDFFPISFLFSNAQVVPLKEKENA
ncbi:MAG TPA: hypothetical protein VLY84_00255 [Dysgonamonadaceae bacterium]|nr:hypothetical protein [Dysgonamonadaceae bacterium]